MTIEDYACPGCGKSYEIAAAQAALRGELAKYAALVKKAGIEPQ